jgi:hypothetical protein
MRSRTPPRVSCLAAALGVALGVSAARADDAPAPPVDGFVLGGFTFRPSLDVRLRGEYRRHPVDVGGEELASTAVLAVGAASPLPATSVLGPLVKNEVLFEERSRLGLAVDRGPITAAFTLQDARVLGLGATDYSGTGEPALASLAPLDAYLEVHGKGARGTFLRVGRQRVTWGDGRLLGEDDWSETARALDAVRVGSSIGDFDLQALGVLLAAPGALPATAAGGTPTTGSGAELFGVDAVWHLFPLLQIEGTGLARVVREPTPTSLTSGDTYVGDARLFGDRAGLRYALEGAYEGGSVPTVATTATGAVEAISRKLSAFALAGRASYETPLLWRLTVGVEGAYASGDDGAKTGTLARFDPLLPSTHDTLGPMGDFAWSNLTEVGATIGLTPIEPLGVELGYRLADLADARGRWTSASLAVVGQATDNTSKSLGSELDAAFKLTPWSPLELQTGYGVFIHGEGARTILREAGRQATLDHWVYLQAEVRAP